MENIEWPLKVAIKRRNEEVEIEMKEKPEFDALFGDMSVEWFEVIKK